MTIKENQENQLISPIDLNRLRLGQPVTIQADFYPSIKSYVTKYINDRKDSQNKEHSALTKLIVAGFGNGKTTLCRQLTEQWLEAGYAATFVTINARYSDNNLYVQFFKDLKTKEDGFFSLLLNAVKAIEDIANAHWLLRWVYSNNVALSKAFFDATYQGVFWDWLGKELIASFNRENDRWGIGRIQSKIDAVERRRFFIELSLLLSKQGMPVLCVIDEVESIAAFRNSVSKQAILTELREIVDNSMDCFSLLLTSTEDFVKDGMSGYRAIYDRLYNEPARSAHSVTWHLATMRELQSLRAYCMKILESNPEWDLIDREDVQRCIESVFSSQGEVPFLDLRVVFREYISVLDEAAAFGPVDGVIRIDDDLLPSYKSSKDIVPIAKPDELAKPDDLVKLNELAKPDDLAWRDLLDWPDELAKPDDLVKPNELAKPDDLAWRDDWLVESDSSKKQNHIGLTSSINSEDLVKGPINSDLIEVLLHEQDEESESLIEHEPSEEEGIDSSPAVITLESYLELYSPERVVEPEAALKESKEKRLDPPGIFSRLIAHKQVSLETILHRINDARKRGIRVLAMYSSAEQAIESGFKPLDMKHKSMSYFAQLVKEKATGDLAIIILFTSLKDESGVELSAACDWAYLSLCISGLLTMTGNCRKWGALSELRDAIYQCLLMCGVMINDYAVDSFVLRLAAEIGEKPRRTRSSSQSILMLEEKKSC